MGLYDEIAKEYKKQKNKKNAFQMPNENTPIKIVYEQHKDTMEKTKKEYETALNKEYTRLGGSQNTGLVGSKKTTQNSFSYANKNKKQNTLIQDLMIRDKANQNGEVADKLDEYAGAYNKYVYANYLYNQNKVNNEKTNLWDKTGGVIVRGLADMFSTAYDTSYIDENGKEIYLPSYNDLKQEKVRKDYDTSIGRFLGDVGYNATKIGGAMAMDALLPGSGSATYWQDMFVDGYKKSINQGYDQGSAAAYSLVNVGFEYGTGKLLGGATGKLTGGSAKQLDNALSNAAFKLTKNPKMSRILGTAGSEATEEFVQEYLDNLSKMAILEKNTNVKDYVSMFTDLGILEDALYSAGVGAASGGFIEGSTASNTDSNIKMFETFKEQLEIRKKNITDENKINQYNEIIENIDNYLEKPYSATEETTEDMVNNISTLPVEETNTNPLANLQEFTQKQQEIKQQQQAEETNQRINTLEQQLEEQGNRILEESESQREAMIENFKQYLEENNITNPTQQDINDSITDLMSYDNDLDFADTARAEQLYNQYVKEYMQENGIPFNNGDSLKQSQLDIIKKSNPMQDDYHTGIMDVEDIKTLEETLNDSDYIDYDEFNPDLTRQDIENAIKSGMITVYSSYPIENGVFVSPSRMEAESYSGNGKIYSKQVPINDIAWIDPTQGQYAKVQSNIPTARDFNQLKLPTVENTKVAENLLTNSNEKIKQQLKQNSDGRILGYESYVNFMANVFENNINYSKLDLKTDNSLIKQYNQNANELLRKLHNQISSDNLTRTMYLKNENTNQMEKVDLNVLISLGNIKHSMNYGVSNQKLTLIPYIDELINTAPTGVIAEETKSRLNNEKWYYLYNSVTLDNNLYGVKIDIKKTNQGDRFQVHRVNLINEKGTSIQEIELDNSRYTVEQDVPSVDNDTTKDQKSQISLPTYNMQQNEKIIPKNPTKESSYETEPKKKTQKAAREELKEEMGITLDDIAEGKDINSLDFQRTDPIRLNEKVFGAKVGQKINDATINKTKHNEAERTRFLNKEREEISKLGIKPRSKESAAVQKYGEKQYINDKGEITKYGDRELASEFKDEATRNKIKHAAEVLRNKYDTYIEDINNVITEMGYDPIPKRPDYMRHFQEINDKLSQWGIPLNPTDMSKDTLPTDINGITDQFKPGKNWFASAMQRKGLKTTYDAITGIDGYLEGASNLIYHTEDIQRYRALSKFIRDTYGQQHGMDNIDPSTEEGQKRLNDIFDNKLSKYAAWLDEQANALAGKKGGIDRAAERMLGRKIYTVLDAAKKQVGSNMTGFNVRSALTNFASAVQGIAKTKKLSFIKGTVSTLKNIVHKDGLIDKSDFLTNRFGSDQLSKKLWQKASNAGQIFMTGTDYFTANQIWRSKYYEYLDSGMNESQAIKKADDFAARIMGDRSKGSTAEVFNSKTLGLLTQFQLEVNNQWSSIIHDNKMDLKTGNKSGATVMFQLGQLAAMSYFFNSFMKSLTGSDVMIDPIDMLKKMLGDDDEDKTLEEKAQEVIGDIWNDLPFVSFISGGRIPMKEAFKGVETLKNYATGQKNSYGQKYSLDDVKKDLTESAYYWLLPTGYGQLKKTKKGTEMYDSKLPMPGSYTDSGNLRFRADETTGGKIKAALFGQYSSKEAQKYMDSGYKAISKARLDEVKELDMSASDYRNYREGLNKAGTTNAEKIEYIANSNYSDKEKNIMAKNILNRDFDIKEYNKYDSYEEYDYATKYPDKYSVIKYIAPYDDYNKYKNEITEIRNNTTNDKKETIEYINSLPMNIPQKAMFIKQYYKSFKKYDKAIINYINEQNLTVEEKSQILTQLGFTVRNGRVY